jgi:hypothetical protein
MHGTDIWVEKQMTQLNAHTYEVLLPAKDKNEYFKNHPEYFSEINGERKPCQLCLTNPEVLRIVTNKAKEILRHDPGAPLISVAPNDGERYCECKNCKAIDDAEGTKMGTLLNFVNSIAASIEKEFPTVRVSTLAYLGTTMPPKTITPRKNVVIYLCTHDHAWEWPFCFVTETCKFQEALKAWAATDAAIHIFDYTVNYSHYSLPMPNMAVVASNLRFYLENGAIGVMFHGDGWGFGAENAIMRAWVWAKQLWNQNLDTRQLMRDFIYGYYREAAKPIWEYNLKLFNLWGYWHRKFHTPDTLESENPLLVHTDRYPPNSDLFFRPKSYVDQATALFAKAERLARDPETLRRVKMAKFPLLYVQLCQGVGFCVMTGDNPCVFQPGWVMKAPTKKLIAEYFVLLDEFETIANDEGIERLSNNEGVDLPRKVEKWREMLTRATEK